MFDGFRLFAESILVHIKATDGIFSLRSSEDDAGINISTVLQEPLGGTLCKGFLETTKGSFITVDTQT